MIKHTAGPWEWWTSCSWKRLTSKDENGNWLRQGNVLCPSIASDGHPVLDVSEGDMALIAAAPELYSELRMHVRNCPVCKGEGKALDVFEMLSKDGPHEKTDCRRCAGGRAALAKAEGRP